ncbi:MAG: hypothetical protein J7L47_08785 [Candidatus Odinarchaeota archaeon]|nr:hypothetical protein [Candidatus Odinarchaeota archaeon]
MQEKEHLKYEKKVLKFEVLKEILEKDFNYGGVITHITGAKGAGKTTLLLRLAENLIKNEKVLWRGMFSCQWFFSTIPVNLILPKKIKATLIVMDKHASRKAEPEDVADRVSYFTSIKQVYTKTRRKYLNVIYFINILDWLDLFELLIKREDVSWISIIFDEMEDLFPMNPSGSLWKEVERGAQIIKEFRKNYISLYMVSQKISDIDYRITNKVNYRIYLRGAKVPRNSIVDQMNVNFLEPGRGIIESSYFQHFYYKDIIRPEKRIKIKFYEELESPSP